MKLCLLLLGNFFVMTFICVCLHDRGTEVGVWCDWEGHFEIKQSTNHWTRFIFIFKLRNWLANYLVEFQWRRVNKSYFGSGFHVGIVLEKINTLEVEHFVTVWCDLVIISFTLNQRKHCKCISKNKNKPGTK